MVTNRMGENKPTNKGLINITNYQRSANQNYNIISYQPGRSSSKSPQTINAREGVERRESFYTVCGNVNWYSHYGEQYGVSLKS